MRKFGNYFLQGLVFLVPLGLTAWLFVTVFRWLDGWLGAPIPGAGLAVLVASSALLGWILSRFVSRRARRALDSFFRKVPVAALIYSSVKDLMSAFVGEKKRFDKPVLVGLGGDVYALGFITRTSLESLLLPEHVAVYFPQAYNFAGQMVLVPRRSVRAAPMDPAQFMAFIVSAGVTSGGAPVSLLGSTDSSEGNRTLKDPSPSKPA